MSLETADAQEEKDLDDGSIFYRISVSTNALAYPSEIVTDRIRAERFESSLMFTHP